jgi:cytoskeleton protein RodZ
MTAADVSPSPPDAGAAPAAVAASAGALLRQAREAAGMSLDAAAGQLKLAPRQVRAIEDGDFAQLPGRTFVRGFVRNYARLVGLDPDTVLAALPAAAAAPALEAPALHETAPTMGELPSSERTRPGWTRWAIPLTLVAIVAAAAVYEFMRGPDTRQSAPPAPAAAERPAPAPAAVPAPGPAPAAPEPAGMPLPNPVAAPVGATDAATGAPPGPATGAAPAGPEAAEAPVVLAFRAASWAEVRDRTGRVLLSQTVPAGQTQTLTGTPPFEVHLGNAQDVAVTFKGKAVDLAPYTRQNIARFTLP